MVWPKRKILLVASSAAPGIEGVRAVLKGIQLEFSEVEPAEDFSEGFTESWYEKPLVGMSSSSEELVSVTDLVYWPGEIEDDFQKDKALRQGINQQPIQAFIHNILNDELIIPITDPIVITEGRPLLGHVLNAAGFEPSILWPTTDGRWQCERRQGLHWLIPESWLAGLVEESLYARDYSGVEEKATWVVRETGVDFYREQKGLNFVGQIPRWSEALEEEAAYQDIAKCLDIGVSWLDIRLALSFLWNDKIMTDNLRCNNDDFGWNARACGEQLPAGSPEYMENWWAR